jgi:uncharacterized protein (DUF305 family)
MKPYVVFTLTILLAAAAIAQTPDHDHAAMMADFDRMFADAMTKHHEEGIRMSEMAVEKAASAELRAMARKMIESERSQIERMQRLRPEGPKMSMEQMHAMPGMMPESEMKRDMARLEAASGREFDLVFTEVMPKHHAGAVEMAQHEIDRGSVEGMKEVAREIAAEQSKEREELMAMHRAMSAGAEPPAAARPLRTKE